MLSLRRASMRIAPPLLALTLLAAPLSAQREWIPPQDPCDPGTGHFLVNGARQHLTLAVEAEHEDQRESRLRLAHEVLMRAIIQNRQDDNPGAWYYLARYYYERGDAPGADSAFDKVVEMLPECGDEANRYLNELFPDISTGALEQWQEGNIDSAVVLFQLSRSLMPDYAELPLFMSMMYVSQDQFDSASKYLDLGIELAADNPDLRDRQHQAMVDLARGYERVAFESPALSAIGELRVTRDTLMRAIEQDSVRLADLIAEWSGQNLRPDVQEAVQRDSTMLANRLMAARTELAPAAETYARDSAAASEAFVDALQAYERLLELYPDDVETLLRLTRRYSMLGHAGRLDELAERAATNEDVEIAQLAQLGAGIFNDGFAGQATVVLEEAVARNPYSQSALYVLTRVYYSLAQADPLMTTAQQLVELDPLNQQAVRMLAAAWNFKGESDSVLKYVALADTGLGWGFMVTQFLPTESTAVLNGSVSNISLNPLEATTLVFEFLDADGTVLGTAHAEVPPLESRRRHAISVRADAGSAVGWRYRRQ